MWLQSEAGIWAQADARVFGMLMGGNRTERRMLAANRTVQGALRKVNALRRFRATTDAHEHRAAERGIEHEFAGSWGRSMLVRLKPIKPNSARANRARRAANLSRTSMRAIRAYKAPLVDGRGRIALYFRIRYLGLKSKNWRPGLAGDHVFYILRDEALENGEVAVEMAPLSNMGNTPEEIAACWDALEEVEQGYRSNAKVQYRIIWNLPHGLNAEERRELVSDFCERTFARLGLPWVAGIHEPDVRGDQRNHHAHVCFSIRPCERVGEHEWAIAQEKVNGLTDEDGLRLMRALAAGHMNQACRAADLPVRFTHQTYKERGIDAVRQEHVGPAAMAAHENGTPVGVIERNALIVEQNEAAYERDAVARAVTATGRLIAMIAQRIDLETARRKCAEALTRARRIADAARMIASSTRPLTLDVQPRDTVMKIGERARAIVALIANRDDVDLQRIAAMKAAIIITGQSAIQIQERCEERDHHRGALAANRQIYAETHKRLQERKAEVAAAEREEVRATILTAPVRPYSVENGQLVLDVSKMNETDRTRVVRLSSDELTSALLERHRRDRESDESESRDRQAEAERQRREMVLRQARVDEACRVIRETPSRPYRRSGKAVVLNASPLIDVEREILATVDPADREISAALGVRAEQDRIDDAIDALCTTVMEERVLLTVDSDKHRVIDSAMFLRFGISADAVAAPSIQKRLDDIAEHQRMQISQMVDYLTEHPGHLEKLRNDRWHLAPEAPRKIATAVDDWQHEPLVRSFLNEIAASLTRPASSLEGPPSPQEPDEVVPSTQDIDAGLALTRRHRILTLAARQGDSLTNSWVNSRRHDEAVAPLEVPTQSVGHAAADRRQAIQRAVRDFTGRGG